MRNYKLTFIDKLYMCFVSYYHRRYWYLFPKVYKHQKAWFYENNINYPYDFYKYVGICVDNLINEFEIGEG